MSTQEQIATARSTARALYQQLETRKRLVQDASLGFISQDVDYIPRNSCNLRNFKTFSGHQFKVAGIRWSQNSKTLLTASQDGFMIIWDAVTGYKKHAIKLENPWVLTCAYSPSESIVASAGLDNVCTIYRQQGFHPLQMDDGFPPQSYPSRMSSVQVLLKGHTAYIPDCDFIGNSNMVTVSGDSTCILWDIGRGKPIVKFTDHTSDVLCMATFRSQQPTNPFVFASGSSDGTMKLWDTRTRNNVRSYHALAYDVNCLSIFPDSNAIALGLDDGSINLYDIRSDCVVSKYSLESQQNKMNYYPNQLPPLLSALTPPTSSKLLTRQESIQSSINLPGVTSVDFSGSGRLLYTTYSESCCLIWDTLKSEVVGSVGNTKTSKFSHVSVSPDGEALAAVGWDASISIWTSDF